MSGLLEDDHGRRIDLLRDAVAYGSEVLATIVTADDLRPPRSADEQLGEGCRSQNLKPEWCISWPALMARSLHGRPILLAERTCPGIELASCPSLSQRPGGDELLSRQRLSPERSNTVLHMRHRRSAVRAGVRPHHRKSRVPKPRPNSDSASDRDQAARSVGAPGRVGLASLGRARRRAGQAAQVRRHGCRNMIAVSPAQLSTRHLAVLRVVWPPPRRRRNPPSTASE